MNMSSFYQQQEAHGSNTLGFLCRNDAAARIYSSNTGNRCDVIAREEIVAILEEALELIEESTFTRDAPTTPRDQ
jgi:hypothetical protein